MTRRRMITIQTLDFKFACRGTSSGVVRLAGPAKVTQKLKTEKKKKKTQLFSSLPKKLENCQKAEEVAGSANITGKLEKTTTEKPIGKMHQNFCKFAGKNKQTNKQTKKRFRTLMKSQKI